MDGEFQATLWSAKALEQRDACYGEEVASGVGERGCGKY